METYVKMVKQSYRFGCSYFNGSKMMDKFFNEIGEYEEMVLRCTYPELSEIDIEEIEEFVLSDEVSPQEVLEEFGLKDREERMREVVEVLSEMDREEWGRYFEECRMKLLNEGIVENYWRLRELVRDGEKSMKEIVTVIGGE